MTKKKRSRSKPDSGSRETLSKIRDQKPPTVSACMMVKNEEELLPQCLESIKDVVDEIIVVDTGSTDRTVEIASRYGAKVFHHPWEDDFSKHRNQSISYATSDWIFIIDADETLSAEGKVKFKQTLLGVLPEVSYLYFQVVDMDSKGKMTSVMNSPRLFRNHMGFKYKNIIHNELDLKGRGDTSGLVLFHYGYHLPPEKMRAKFERTIRLLKKRMEDDPSRPEAPFFLCKSYGMEKQSPEAIYYGLITRQKLERMGDVPLFYVEIFYIMALSFYRMKMYILAEATCLEGLRLFPKYIDLYFILGDICRILGRFEEALRHSRQYLELKQFFEKNPEQRKSLTFYTLGYHELLTRSLDGIRKLLVTKQQSISDLKTERHGDPVYT